MTDLTRRLLLRAGLVIGALAVLPRAVLAVWPAAAFTARDLDVALKNITGGRDLVLTDKIRISAPEVAENGAIVPVTVKISLNDVNTISLLAARNPRPLTSTYLVPAGTLAYVSTRIKMQDTADILAVVKAGGQFYGARRRVEVAVGGCT
jgi:sulfur-oxidizing protein SoxY